MKPIARASFDIRDHLIKKDLTLGKIIPRVADSTAVSLTVQIVKFLTCDRFIKWIGKSELAKIQNQGGQL